MIHTPKEIERIEEELEHLVEAQGAPDLTSGDTPQRRVI